MKKNLLSVSIALMMSAAAFTSCVDNNESDSVKGIRDAKAEQLKSLAGMYKAQGEAELIRANFEKAYRDAETAFQLLQNEEKSMTNEIKKASLLHDIETAIAEAKAKLAEQLKIQAENEADLKLENDKVFGAALTGYTTAFDNLYGNASGINGYVNDLQDAKLELISLKNDLISIERWVADELKTMNEELVALETKKDVYTSMSANDLEKLKAELSAVELEIAKEMPANTEFGDAEDKARDVNNAKSEYLDLNYDFNGSYNVEVRWNSAKWEKVEVIRDLASGDNYQKSTTFVYNPVFVQDVPTYEKNDMADNNNEFERVFFKIKDKRTTSPYVFAALRNPAFFKATPVEIKPLEFVLDAKLNTIARVGGDGDVYVKYELIDAEGYQKLVSDQEKIIKDLDKAKTDAIATYDAAKTVTATAKAAWETATAVDKPAKEALYKAAKLQSNIARLEMDYAKSTVDGGQYIYRSVTSNVAVVAPGDANSKTATGITGETIEGVYDGNNIVVTTVVVDATNTTTTVSTYRVYQGGQTLGEKAYFNDVKAEYDMLTSTGTADYKKAIDEYLAANTAYAAASKNTMISNYTLAAANAKQFAIKTLISQTQDVPALIKELEEDIADKKAEIEDVKNLADLSGDTASKKELAIAIQEQTIVKLNASIAVEEALLKKFKAEIDALTK